MNAGKAIAGILLFTMLSGPARAEYSAHEALVGLKNEDETVWVFITGVHSGILFSNEIATSQGTPLFCLPETARLDREDMIRYLESDLARFPGLNVIPVALVLASALKDAFPCLK